MKLEKKIKNYYSEKISRLGPVPYPASVTRMAEAGHTRRMSFDIAPVNFAVHILLAAAIAGGLLSFGTKSALALEISRCAAHASLDVIIESKVNSLNSGIILLRNNLNKRRML